MSDSKSTHLVITGDLNFPKDVVSWLTTEEGTVPVPKTCHTSTRKLQLQELLELTDKLYLHQVINTPTRTGPPSNILDLLFTNTLEMFHSLETIDMSGTSDHSLVNLETEFSVEMPVITKAQLQHTEIQSYNFERAHSDNFKKALITQKLVKIVRDSPDPIVAKRSFEEAVVKAATEAEVPKHQPSKRKDHSEAIRRLYRARSGILRKLRAKKLSTMKHKELHKSLKDIQKQVAEVNHAEAIEKERLIAEDIKLNPKRFYKYANTFKKTKSKIGPLKSVKDNKPFFESGPQKMAELLNAQYQSQFTTPKTPHPAYQNKTIDAILSDINIQDIAMCDALRSISYWSTAGPDGITPFLLRIYADELSPALCALWRKSLDTGIMPDDINLAYITPIFKGGSKSDPANYRPIALTNHITKAFEKIVKDEIVHHLSMQQLLNPTQHGFTSGKSTLTNLIEYYESILLLLQHHQSVDSIYLDYSKAFDKCDHNIILEKLHGYGVRDKLLDWITAFLKRRQQIVVVQGSRSKPVWCVSGVPQGSVLGPLLFLVLMLDITKGINHSCLSSFADDTKIWKAITNTMSEVLLQDDLDMIYLWANENNMEFNSKKFQAIRFAEVFGHSYYANDKQDLLIISNS